MGNKQLSKLAVFLLTLGLFGAQLSVTPVQALVVNPLENGQQILFGSEGSRPKFYRIPSLVVVNKNKYVVAFAEERIANGNADSGDINVVFKYSTNHGKTWSEKNMLCERGRDTCGNPTAVVDQRNGRIHIFMNANAGYKKQLGAETDRERIKPGDRRILYSSAVFNGTTLKFSNPKDLTQSLQYADMAWDAVGPGNGIQLEKGQHKGRLLIPAIGRTFYSDDAGKTWKLHGFEPGDKRPNTALFTQTSETAIAELPNGMIVRNSRAVGSFTHRMVSFSSDGGLTFSEPRLDYSMPDPKSQGSLLRYANSEVISANCAHTTRRQKLTLKLLKADLGPRYVENNVPGEEQLPQAQTWTALNKINSNCGYSSLAKTRDFNIAVLWEQATHDADARAASAKAKDIVFEKHKLNTLS